MEPDLSNRVAGVPERFEPAAARGELTEAEHLVRYAWAARLAPGRRVLDAGCGVGYGTRMLRAAGAAEAVGVDVAPAVVEAAAADAEPGVSFEVGDVHDLDFADGSFDLVVCLEVIEHVEDRRRVIAELARVLARGGVLVVSSPNRAAYVPGNPHHVHEYLPDELHAALAESLEHVRLYRQHDWICSAVLDDETFAADGLRPVRDLWVEKVAGAQPGRETYTLALAGDAPLPDPPSGAVITGTAEVRKWLELYHEQQEILDRQREHLHDLGELRLRLEEAEFALARVPSLEQERDELRARAEAAERNLVAVTTSPSWRATSPLRMLKRAVGRARGGRR